MPKEMIDTMSKFNENMMILSKQMRESESLRARGHNRQEPEAREEDRHRSRSPIYQGSPYNSPQRMEGSEDQFNWESNQVNSEVSTEITAAIQEVWPDVMPMWEVSEEEAEAILKYPTPILFYVPSDAWCDRDGVYFDEESSVSNEQAFLGDWKGTPVIAFWARNFVTDRLMTDLRRVSFADKKPFTRKSLAGLTTNLVSWIDLEEASWVPSAETGRYTMGESYRFDARMINNVSQALETKERDLPSPWFQLTSEDEETKNILAFIYGNKLPETGHLIEDLSQTITDPVDSYRRERDWRVRRRTGLLLNLDFSWQLCTKVLSRLQDNSIEEQHRSSMLTKLQKFMTGTWEASQPLSKHMLRECALARLNCRKKATKK